MDEALFEQETDDHNMQSSAFTSIARRVKLLDDRVDALISQVEMPNPTSPLYDLCHTQRNIIRCFLSGFAVDSPDEARVNVWKLLEWNQKNGRLPENFLDIPEIAQERDYLSKPLTDAPLDILLHITASRSDTAWWKAQDLNFKLLTPDQQSTVRFVYEEGM